MTTHTYQPLVNTFYFVTITCYKWLPLIESAGIYAYFIRWFKNMKRLGCPVCGYVIMPNHIHLLVYLSKQADGLNSIISGAKRFLAYEIVKGLEKNKEAKLLALMKKGVASNEQSKNKKHQVFRLSFDSVIADGVETINRILDYMHHNPVSGKWNLVDDYADFPYSSAGFYEKGTEDGFGCMDFREYF